MEDAMDMSLDDYINSFKQMKKQNANSTTRSEESKFKEGRREQNDDEAEPDEEELTLQCQEDDYVSLALDNPGDPSMEETEIEPNDLRNKIVGRFPQSSQQWRLVQPNIMNVRPAGMPPLVPSDAPQNTLSGGNGYYKHKWRNYNHRQRRNNGNNNWQNNNNHRNNNNNNSNGRVQRFNNNSRANLNSKNIKIVLEQLKQRNPMILYSSVGTPDLTIEAASDDPIGFTNFTIPKIIKAEAKAQTNVMETVDTAQSKGSEAIKSLLGVSEIGIRNDMMPALAGRLLDILNGTNPTMHKPMYDMKIQKEIHEIQKKPLLYKCPGGEVVSSDGAGIPDCKIQPKVSGISLNNRFA